MQSGGNPHKAVSDEAVPSSPSTPKLFLVQPRLTPPKFLQAKLNEALCLANSLEEERYGYFESDFFEAARSNGGGKL
ncbi:hypothetical protein Bca52824_019400 [Brassica carinata]|uniref:Uncharacterized protein n=1 Tax=Brassica carinata TaxID=52824 RepID=A0A8X7VQP9_BRACI|nr:hypothetical protein Bca52824_019400 [Brassica carinata]